MVCSREGVVDVTKGPGRHQCEDCASDEGTITVDLPLGTARRIVADLAESDRIMAGYAALSEREGVQAPDPWTDDQIDRLWEVATGRAVRRDPMWDRLRAFLPGTEGGE